MKRTYIAMQVKFNVLDRQFLRYQDEYEAKALEVLRSGWYVLGREVNAFEQEFAAYVGSRFAVGLASGLDALWLSFKILGIGRGDEVIVPANAYIACIMGVTINGATPVFVEPDAFYNLDADAVLAHVTPRTKAILPVHLYGQACRMDVLRRICDENKLYLIEDCAQSHGATFDGRPTNNYADISCYSFYPTKNLGCFGDGGAISTNNEDFAKQLRVYRNYGSEKRYHNMVVGANSRLDELQAGLLRIKLKHIEELNAERTVLAERYLRGICSPFVKLPRIAAGATSVWHLFVVSCLMRDRLMDYLKENGIETVIHYPIPPHLSEAYRDLGYTQGSFPIAEEYARTVLSLPLYNGMTDDEQQYVIDKINAFEGLDE